jgi:hypothetical protein
MKDKVYLICTPQGVVKMVRNPGKAKPGQVAIEVRVGVDPRIFFPSVPPVDIQVRFPEDNKFEVNIAKKSAG